MSKKTILLVLIALFCFSGCDTEKSSSNNENIESTTCGNITMGEGKFAYSEDFIYFAGVDMFYEYDLVSKETITFSAKGSFFPDSIFIEDEYIYFADGGLKRITRDGKKINTVYDNTNGALQLYVDDTKAYFMDSLDGTLYCRDLESEQEEALLSGMLSYHIDNGYIYAIAKNNDFRQLYQSDISKIDFEPVKLGFEPITVFSEDGILYMAKKMTYELVQYKDGIETVLPIFSTYYQVVDEQLIYLDSDTFENSCFDLKIYNMNTKEFLTICEDVYSFCVFEDKYIAIHRYDANLLYDMDKETLELMYEIE